MNFLHRQYEQTLDYQKWEKVKLTEIRVALALQMELYNEIELNTDMDM